MKTIWDYPVKYVYGFSQDYGPTFHTGEDRTITDGRTDIQVTVNGISIGVAGTTGLSTGLHTHIGKWLNGQHYPPFGGGAEFNSAIVTGVDTVGATDNGKFVRIQGDGYSWVYLHLASVKVSVGTILKGGAMEELAIQRQKMLQGIAQIVIPNFTGEVDGNNYPQIVANIHQLYKQNNDVTKIAEDRLKDIRVLSEKIKVLESQVGGKFKPYTGPPLFVEDK